MRFTTLAVSVFGIVATVTLLSFLMMLNHLPNSKPNKIAHGKDPQREVTTGTIGKHGKDDTHPAPAPKPKHQKVPAPKPKEKTPVPKPPPPKPEEYPPMGGKLPAVLWWESSAVSFLGQHNLQMPEPCPVKCEYHTDHNRLNESEAILFHLPTFYGYPPNKNKNQVWIMLCMEGVENYPRLADKPFMDTFDVKMTYSLDSDIVTGYWSGDINTWYSPPRPKTQEALAVFMASNCGPRNGRNEWVQGLMKYIKVDSYGACFHNKDFNVTGNTRSWDAKLETIARYKFYLAFENSNSVDYVSEKMFQALYMGVVPIYMGAPNVDEFLPEPKAVIKTDDFKTPEDLAKYLMYLDKNETAYQEHLAWKFKEPTPRLKQLLDMLKWDTRCELCVRLYQMRKLGRWPPNSNKRLPPKEHRL